MATTREIEMSAAWLAVAAGAGTATISPLDANATWAVSSGAPPTVALGHRIAMSETVSMDLEAGETLYVRGRGQCSVTAKNPLP